MRYDPLSHLIQGRERFKNYTIYFCFFYCLKTDFPIL